MSNMMKPSTPVVSGTNLSVDSVDGATSYKAYSVRIEPEQGATTIAKIIDDVLYVYNMGGGSGD